jgi:hypothetical protein
VPRGFGLPPIEPRFDAVEKVSKDALEGLFMKRNNADLIGKVMECYGRVVREIRI